MGCISVYDHTAHHLKPSTLLTISTPQYSPSNPASYWPGRHGPDSNACDWAIEEGTLSENWKTNEYINDIFFYSPDIVVWRHLHRTIQSFSHCIMGKWVEYQYMTIQLIIWNPAHYWHYPLPNNHPRTQPLTGQVGMAQTRMPVTGPLRRAQFWSDHGNSKLLEDPYFLPLQLFPVINMVLVWKFVFMFWTTSTH